MRTWAWRLTLLDSSHRRFIWQNVRLAPDVGGSGADSACSARSSAIHGGSPGWVRICPIGQQDYFGSAGSSVYTLSSAIVTIAGIIAVWPSSYRCRIRPALYANMFVFRPCGYCVWR